MPENEKPANSENFVIQDDEREPLDGEIVDEAAAPPREGTLAWLQLQEHVHIDGLGEIPARHKLDLVEGSLYLGEDDGRCRYERPERGRCGAPRLLAYGLCLVHAGGGSDMSEIGKRGGAAKTRLRLHRQVLGIGPSRAADPRQLARLRAHSRAEEIAAALLAPLDDSEISALAQQRSAVTILDTLWPQQTVQLTVEMPADSEGVSGMGWADMQALAAQLLGDSTETAELEPA